MAKSWICCCAVMFAALAAAAVELRLPDEFSPSDGCPVGDGRSWRQYGEIALAYSAARSKVELALRKQGWIRLKAVDYDTVRWKSVELWERNGERILLQFWRAGVSRTGFAWGTVDEQGKR